MKRVLVLLLIILSGTCKSIADDCCPNNKYDFSRDYKCSQLIQRIRFQKNTLYNVLNLSIEQQELKDEIELRRSQELKTLEDEFKCEQKKLRTLAQSSYNSSEFKKQRKVTKKALKNYKKAQKKYDKELLKILCSTQKSKYKEIVRLTRRDVRYCYLNKKSSPKDPYVNSFGLNDAKDICDVCNKHNYPHLFNRKCKYIEELEN